MADTLEMWGKEWTNVTGFKANNDQHTQLTFYRPQGTITITSNGTTDVTAYASASVLVNSGIDVPIFTVTIDSNYELDSITCNKTYAECLEWIMDDNWLAGISFELEEGGYTGLIPVVCDLDDYESPSPTIQWRSIMSNGFPEREFFQYPNGTISLPVDVDAYENPEITTNGYHYPSYGKVFTSVNVHVTPNLQSRTATPTESVQTIMAESGYDGLSSVEIGAISSTYVGSGITSRSSADLTASGATVTAPAGYYASVATKSVASGSATTPATTVTANPSISVSSGGLITATASATKSVTPTVSAGYVSSGTAGTITVSGSNTQQLDTIDFPTSASSSATSGYTSKATISRSTSDQYINIGTGYNTDGAYYKINATPNGTVTAPSSISGTSANVSTGTNTITLSKTVSVTPSVTTAGYVSSGTAGNASVSLTASVTTKGATTYNTSSTDQTISASQYLTGAQTIKAVTTSGISAANIKAGVTVTVGDTNDADRIAGVTGTFTSDGTATASDIVSGKSAYVNGNKIDGSLTFSTITVSSSNPTGGSNGDIWIKTS